MDLTQILTIVLAAILGPGGGLVAAYIALRKLPLEKRAADVDVQAAYMEMAAKVPEIYEGIFEDFREDLSAQEKRIVELERGHEADAALIAGLDRQLKVAVAQVAALEDSNKALLKERGELALKLVSLETRNNDFSIRLKQTEQRLKEAENQIKALEDENRILRDERDRLLRGSDRAT